MNFISKLYYLINYRGVCIMLFNEKFWDLKTGELQKTVDDIRKLEGLTPITINTNNIELAFDYVWHKSFNFYMNSFLDGVIIQYSLYKTPEKTIPPEIKAFLEKNKISLSALEYIENFNINEIIDGLPSFVCLYKALINDPMLVYCSPSILGQRYNIKFEYAKIFKELISSFHKEKKNFEKSTNLFNYR